MTLVCNLTTRSDCESCAVRHSALCRALPPEALRRMNRLAVRRRIAAGRLIMISPQDQNALATIVSGVVKLVGALADGRQQIVALQFAGSFIGDPFGIGLDSTPEAATDVVLCCLGSEHVEVILAEYPQMQMLLVRHIMAELQTAREWMLLLGRKTAEEKVASLFLLLAERAADYERTDAGVVRITLPISRTDIADYLGLTIETVSRQIARLKDLGVLSLASQRSAIVPDLDALRRVAEPQTEY